MDLETRAPRGAPLRQSWEDGPVSSSDILEIGMHTTAHGGLNRFFIGWFRGWCEVGCRIGRWVLGILRRAISLGPENLPPWGRLRRIRREVKCCLAGKRNAVIVSHFTFYALLIVDLLGRLPCVVLFHGPWSSESVFSRHSAAAVWAKRQFERAVYRRARRLIVLSGAFRELLGIVR